MKTVEFGTTEYWKNKWKEIFNRRKKGDSLSRHNMREVAQKVLVKRQKEDKKRSGD